MQKFTVYGRLPSLNNMISADRSNKHVGAKLKRESLEAVMWYIRAAGLKRIDKPVVIHYRFYEENRLRDVGNIIAGADKVIEDALVKCRILHNDGQSWVRQIDPWVDLDRKNPRIEIELEEIE